MYLDLLYSLQTIHSALKQPCKLYINFNELAIHDHNNISINHNTLIQRDHTVVHLTLRKRISGMQKLHPEPGGIGQ